MPSPHSMNNYILIKNLVKIELGHCGIALNLRFASPSAGGCSWQGSGSLDH